MAQSESSLWQNLKRNFPFLTSMYRGLTAIFLGFVLLINPERSSSLLGNFMGFFWISSGLILLRRESDIALEQLGKRTSLVVGLVAVVTGLLVVTRRITEIWVDPSLVIQLLGVVIFLTGLLHIFGQARIIRVHKNNKNIANLILGVFEMILGGLLIYSPLERGPIMYWVAMVWALIGGGMIIGTAVYDRFKAHQHKKDGLDEQVI